MRAGLKKGLGDVGHDVAGLLDVRARARSATIVGRMELTRRAHDVEA
jgi:hypothetical protein